MFGWRSLEGCISEDKDLQNQMNRRDMKGKGGDETGSIIQGERQIVCRYRHFCL